ncbi:MAG: IclR family transcriptional regulator domain-containing protein [Actinomycetota bacterium]
MASVSAPVLDGGDRIVASISLSGPIDRLGREPGARYAAAVVDAARAVARAGGLRHPE